MDQDRLSRKVSIVTGGASGIGEETVRALAKRGDVVILADIDSARAESLARSLTDEGGICEFVDLDMGDHARIASIAQDLIDRHGGIDCVVNCAVRTSLRDVDVAGTDPALWMELLGVNLVGPAALSRAVIPAMLARGGGAFVHIASATGLRGEDTRTCYGAAKAALMQLSRSIAVQYGQRGIRSNCLAPGLIMTPAADAAFDASILALFQDHNQTPELGRPADVAETILFLLSPAARFINGHTLVIDGGFTITAPIVPDMRRAGL